MSHRMTNLTLNKIEFGKLVHGVLMISECIYACFFVCFLFWMSPNVSVMQSSVVMCDLQWQMSNDSFNHEIYISPANGLPKNSIHFIFSGRMTILCVRVEISARDFSCLIRLAKHTAEYLTHLSSWLLNHGPINPIRIEKHGALESWGWYCQQLNHLTVTNKQNRVCGVTLKAHYKTWYITFHKKRYTRNIFQFTSWIQLF